MERVLRIIDVRDRPEAILTIEAQHQGHAWSMPSWSSSSASSSACPEVSGSRRPPRGSRLLITTGLDAIARARLRRVRGPKALPAARCCGDWPGPRSVRELHRFLALRTMTTVRPAASCPSGSSFSSALVTVSRSPSSFRAADPSHSRGTPMPSTRGSGWLGFGHRLLRQAVCGASRRVRGDPRRRGRKLQLPVYGLAARSRLGDVPVRVAYWFVSEKGNFKQICYDLDPAALERFSGRGDGPGRWSRSRVVPGPSRREKQELYVLRLRIDVPG